MAIIGNVSFIPMEISVVERSHHIEWKILDFTSISGGDNYYVRSPPFSFDGESWNLELYPNGRNKANSIGYICLYLSKISAGTSVKLEYSLGLKTLNGEKFLEHYRTYTFRKANSACGVHKCILRSDLLERTSVFSPTDPLTFFCNLKYPKAVVNGSNAASAKCSHCKETFEAESLSSHEKKCLDKPVKCPECSNVVVLQNWYDHVCEAKSEKDDGSLCQDYKKVLLDGHNHDLILKVGDKELQAHRDILRARSRVFESMLDHNMKEKNGGVIDIPDCKLQAMEQFLSYVYCGKVETLDQSNMLELYYVADKYEMMGLKIECTNFIQNSLCLTNICSVIQLALNHSDSDLLEHATEYFINNVLDIMHTVEWQSFMKDNSTVSNELLIKAFKKMKKKTP